MRSNDPLTRGEIRAYVFGAAAIVFLIASVIALAYQTKAVDDVRTTCEATNKQRVSELGQRNDLILNARSRAANPATHEEGKAALKRALHRRQQLIASVSDPIRPGSVVRDCKAAYGKPFPFNVLEDL